MDALGETLTDCGACGAVCGPIARATPVCLAGACAVDECLGNFGDCNSDAVDGCELPLDTLANCGSCGRPCAFAGSSTSCGGSDNASLHVTFAEADLLGAEAGTYADTLTVFVEPN